MKPGANGGCEESVAVESEAAALSAGEVLSAAAVAHDEFGLGGGGG